MNCTIRGLKLWTTAGLMLILVLSSGPALAAQIDIKNCTTTDMSICSFDNWNGWPDINAVFDDHRVLYAGGKSHHFTCNSNCVFGISTSTSSKCITTKEICNSNGRECTEDNEFNSIDYSKLDHSWGKGSYLWISWDTVKGKSHYKSGDLTKGTTCP